MPRFFYALSVILLFQWSVWCFAASVSGYDGGSFRTPDQIMRQLDETKKKIEELQRDIKDIDNLIADASGLSEEYRKKAEGFQAVVDAYVIELGSCTAMEAEYASRNKQLPPSPQARADQEAELEKCRERVSESTLDHSEAETYLSSLEGEVDRVRSLAATKKTSADAMQKTLNRLIAKLNWLRGEGMSGRASP